jgi:hypothetical protein
LPLAAAAAALPKRTAGGGSSSGVPIAEPNGRTFIFKVCIGVTVRQSARHPEQQQQQPSPEQQLPVCVFKPVLLAQLLHGVVLCQPRRSPDQHALSAASPLISDRFPSTAFSAMKTNFMLTAALLLVAAVNTVRISTFIH